MDRSYPDVTTYYGGIVYLLIGQQSLSASEMFTLNMNNLDNVVVLGDTTGGAGVFCYTLELENGWEIRAPGWSLRTLQNEPVEWFGIPPDVYVEATEEDFAMGIDPVLEYAIDLINNAE